MKFIRYIFLMWLLIIPINLVAAQVVFTEIMYDLEGSDTDREWIEIQNIGGTSLDLSTWKFFEGNSNHGLILAQGIGELAPNAFAIIAVNPSKFLIDNPNYSGAVFDSSFSLINTGETLILRNFDLSDIDTVFYSSDLGAKGDGNTLQKNGNSWVAKSPTPGSGIVSQGNQTTPPPAITQSSTTETTSSNINQGAVSSSVEQTVFPDAGKDKVVITGASVVFEGIALGIKKEPLSKARYVWNFGDGETAEGKKVTHIYRIPGEYSVLLSVSSDFRTNIDRLLVTAVKTPLSISLYQEGESGFTEITNNSNNELDISWWQISNNFNTFVIPENTIILSQKKFIISNLVSKIENKEGLKLLYPNTVTAFEYQDTKEKVVQSISLVSKSPVVPKIIKTTTRTELVVSKEEINIEPRTAETASALNAFEKRDENSYIWLLSLGALIIISAGALLFLRGSFRKKTGIQIIE